MAATKKPATRAAKPRSAPAERQTAPRMPRAPAKAKRAPAATPEANAAMSTIPITITDRRYSHNVPLAVNGKPGSLPAQRAISVTADQIALLDAAGIVYRKD